MTHHRRRGQHLTRRVDDARVAALGLHPLAEPLERWRAALIRPLHELAARGAGLDDLGADLAAVVLAHHLGRNLAGAKALETGRLADAPKAIGDLLLHLGGGHLDLEMTFEFFGFFDRDLHCSRPLQCAAPAAAALSM